jgi:hypothetical protein
VKLVPQKYSFEKSNGARVGLEVGDVDGATGAMVVGSSVGFAMGDKVVGAEEGAPVGGCVKHLIPAKHVCPDGHSYPPGHAVSSPQVRFAAS